MKKMYIEYTIKIKSTFVKMLIEKYMRFPK